MENCLLEESQGHMRTCMSPASIPNQQNINEKDTQTVLLLNMLIVEQWAGAIVENTYIAHCHGFAGVPEMMQAYGQF